MQPVRCGLPVFGALLVASAPLHGQTLGACVPTDAQAAGGKVSDSSGPAFDLDRPVAGGVLDEQAAVLLRRTAVRLAHHGAFLDRLESGHTITETRAERVTLNSHSSLAGRSRVAGRDPAPEAGTVRPDVAPTGTGASPC